MMYSKMGQIKPFLSCHLQFVATGNLKEKEKKTRNLGKWKKAHFPHSPVFTFSYPYVHSHPFSLLQVWKTSFLFGSPHGQLPVVSGIQSLASDHLAFILTKPQVDVYAGHLRDRFLASGEESIWLLRG